MDIQYLLNPTPESGQAMMVPPVYKRRSKRPKTLWTEFESLYEERVTWEQGVIALLQGEQAWCASQRGPLAIEEYEQLAAQTEAHIRSKSSHMYRHLLTRMNNLYKKYSGGQELELQPYEGEEAPQSYYAASGIRDIRRRWEWITHIIRLIQVDLDAMTNAYLHKDFVQLYYSIKNNGHELFERLKRRNEAFPPGWLSQQVATEQYNLQSQLSSRAPKSLKT